MDNPPYRIYWDQPPVVMTARVNMPGSITYPVQDINFDTVTTGAYTDCSADMFFTLGSAAGLDDYGRGRLRAAPTSTVLKVNRSSQGYEDGELTIVDNAFIAVYDDYRVHAKIATILADHIERKDSDLEVGDLTLKPPPIANLGADYGGPIDATTSLLRVFFPGSNSIAVADAATITGYAWVVGAGTFVLGTTATSADITVDFPAGRHIVHLTVTDSNGKTHTGHRLVIADDPANSLCVSGMQVQNISFDQQGRTARLRCLEDLPRSTYSDGAHVMIWEERDPTIFGSPDPASRDHMLFTGWHQTDNASARALETHLQRETVLTCVDVAGRLDSLPGWPQRVEVPTAADLVDPGMNWGYMPTANMDKFLHYLLQWHSTAASVADFYPSGTWANYPFVLFNADGATLYEQMQRQAARIVPDHNFTCDSFGALRVVVNPQFQNVADRTATVQNNILVNSWTEIDFTYNRPPRVHTTRGSALLTQTAWVIVGSEKELLSPVFCIAPGTAPGQGAREVTLGERLAQSQADLNDCIGHHHAHSNARYGPFNVNLGINSDPWDFKPSDFTWVNFVITAALAPQRGIDFTTTRALCKEVSVDFDYREEATFLRPRVQLEIETVGLPALTETHEDALPVGEQPNPTPYVPPLPGDPEIYHDDIKAYILWDGAHVLRTWDLQAASPAWQWISSGIDGNILDGHCIPVTATTVGMWLLTSTAVWWCADIMATTPTWEEVLPIEDVIAADVAPSAGTVQFGCCFPYWSEPGFLCVATEPTEDVDDYVHCYYWHTHDYGQTWTQTDAGSLTYVADPENPVAQSYSYTNVFSMNIFRSDPGTIWCGRATNRIGTAVGDTVIMRSNDLGHTWSISYNFLDTLGNPGSWSANQKIPSVLNPFPAWDDPAYSVRGRGATSGPLLLHRSEDGFTNAIGGVVELAAAAGYTTIFSHSNVVPRVNKRTFDNTHVMAVWDGTTRDLLESFDQGATWSALKTGLPNSVMTPNGWPVGTEQQWVLIYANDTPRIQLTLDHFATAMLDKTGDLVTVLAAATPAGWVNGLGSGQALPKIPPNV